MRQVLAASDFISVRFIRQGPAIVGPCHFPCEAHRFRSYSKTGRKSDTQLCLGFLGTRQPRETLAGLDIQGQCVENRTILAAVRPACNR